MFRSLGYIALWHYAACAFCLYINGLRFKLVCVTGQAVLCGLGLYGRSVRESVSVFDGFVYL